MQHSSDKADDIYKQWSGESYNLGPLPTFCVTFLKIYLSEEGVYIGIAKLI